MPSGTDHDRHAGVTLPPDAAPVDETAPSDVDPRVHPPDLRGVVDALPGSLVRYDRDGRITFVNREFELRTGRRADEVVGHRPFEWADEQELVDDVAEYRHLLDLVLRTGESQHLDRVRTLASGDIEVFQVLFRAERATDGEIVGAFAMARNVTDIVRLRERLDASEQDFRALAENLPDVLIRYGADARVSYVNRQYDRQIGGPPIVGLHLDAAVRPSSDGFRYRDCVREVFATGRPARVELTIEREPGDARTHSVLVQPELDADGRVVGAIAIGHDVTSLVDAQRAIADREREFRTLAENLPDLLVRYDADAHVTFINRTLDVDDAPALDDVMGSSPLDVPHDDVAGIDEFERRLRGVIATGEPASIDMYFRGRDGHRHVHSFLFHAERDDTGSVVGAIAIGRDITEVVHHREALERAARTDSLTGLASRQVLYEQIPAMLAERRLEGGRAAMLLVDLDGFKHINDQYGHRLGDRILREVADRLRRCVTDDDLLVRLGGDEFVIAMSHMDAPTDASLLAHQVRAALAGLTTDEDVRLPRIDASVGIAVWPDDGGDVDQLLAHADLALYDAKRAGRGRVEFFRAELRTAMERRAAIEDALRRCVPDAEMAVHLQPICALGDEPRVWGAEALLRWNHPELGPIPPDEFVPIAEQIGAIVPIGRWVLRRAAEIAVLLNAARSQPLRISVNVSTRQFTLDDVGDAVRDTLRTTGCDPRWLVLELTESLLLEDAPFVHAAIQNLRRSGVAIAIDDFGTGYSALHYLTRLRVDHMKVDKMFVRDADVDHQQQEIVRALVALAQALGIGVVAEGIETRGQAALLHQLGCRLGQGYLLAHPMPVDRFETWLRSARTTLREALPA
jgi:diguanylate cyclase (GGDEF)-like protein/PAS domain S-box-containing protein